MCSMSYLIGGVLEFLSIVIFVIVKLDIYDNRALFRSVRFRFFKVRLFIFSNIKESSV